MRHGIPEFQARRPLVEQLGAGVLNRILKELESLRIISVVGGSVRKLPGGTEIVVGSNRGRGSNPYHPFEIRLRKAGSNVYAGVVYDSKLFASLRPSDLMPITGLLEAAPDNLDPGWFILEEPFDYIWLEVTFDEGVPDTASIKSLATGTFDPTLAGTSANSYFEQENNALGVPVQTVARKLLAEYRDGVLTQHTDRHQVLTDTIVDGYAVRYPFDHSGWYVEPEE